ncbi:hypothetical protein QQZ08_009822 [Neonectria magnoliae]|uniref:Uncharacterized protein n=1 Tax=Neonectria magnoliae TaxID=2732573 RepID=A0ABR1HKU0_9HYPO
MLANPRTLRITAVLDFEFTNAIPAQYLHNVPSWLLLASPHCWLERDDMRTSIDADVIYRKALEDGKSGEILDKKEMEQFVETKMAQFDAYLKEKENGWGWEASMSC